MYVLIYCAKIGYISRTITIQLLVAYIYLINKTYKIVCSTDLFNQSRLIERKR
jgi:hypothetical protein